MFSVQPFDIMCLDYKSQLIQAIDKHVNTKEIRQSNSWNKKREQRLIGKTVKQTWLLFFFTSYYVYSVREEHFIQIKWSRIVFNLIYDKPGFFYVNILNFQQWAAIFILQAENIKLTCQCLGILSKLELNTWGFNFEHINIQTSLSMFGQVLLQNLEPKLHGLQLSSCVSHQNGLMIFSATNNQQRLKLFPLSNQLMKIFFG